MGKPLAEHEVKQALERLPAELHRLLAWLATGQHVQPSAKDGGR